MNILTKRILMGGGIVLVIALVVFVGFGFYEVSSFENSLEAVTNVSRYAEIKAAWPTNLVSHFPDRAPTSAVFHYHPGFLQGGSSLQLKVTMSQADIAAELSKFSDRIVATYHGGDMNDHANLKNGIPTTFFYTSETNTQKFPDDYAIMVIEAHNGNTAGVAISTQRNIAVYWAESWQ